MSPVLQDWLKKARKDLETASFFKMNKLKNRPDHKLETLLQNNGFDHFGFATLEKPQSMEYYKTWIQNNYHAEMSYLERHIEQKENPQKLLPFATSAIVIAQSYFPPQSESFPLKKTKVALYARQKDYHDWFQQKLNTLAAQLKTEFPSDEFLAFTDSKPVLERDLAYRAGLGWVGKNTCLIDEKRGSLFFIGEIYTTQKLKVKLEVAQDRCGTCTRCIDICPTQALVEPRVLDANKCISYWTIEAKKVAPEPLRTQFQSWYFGCDLCQTVCPWNQRIFKTEMQAELNLTLSSEDKELLQHELKNILSATAEDLKILFQGTPLLRAKPWAHKRNAIYVAVHHGFRDLLTEVESLQNSPEFQDRPDLQELRIWAEQKLKIPNIKTST